MNETSRVFWTLLLFKIKIKIKGLKNSSFEDGVSTSKQQVLALLLDIDSFIP
jgi:hypothetical protein